uniref:uncharacterized protein isoform X2 n=1 Tax=Semicossyphus pulcher TaxID=241346 RepID=UPI0037E7EEC5
MQAVAVSMQSLISGIKDNSNVFVISGLIFSYQTVKGEFPCSCKPQAQFCFAYMLMPSSMLFVLMLATDARFQRALQYTIRTCSSNFLCVLFSRSVKALCVGMLWVASVLLDAEWYVCCWNNNPRNVAELQCEKKKDITPGSGSVVTITEMILNSRLFGLSLLCAITFVVVILLPCRRLFDLTDQLQHLKCCKKEVDVHELILEVGEIVVTKVLEKDQETKLSEKVERNIAERTWVDYLDLVEETIDPTRTTENSDGDILLEPLGGQNHSPGPRNQRHPAATTRCFSV